MSIIHSFDEDRHGVADPCDVLPKSRQKLDVCIINFSYKIMDALSEDGLLVPIDDVPAIKSVAHLYPVYLYKGSSVGVVQTTVGAPITAGLIEEISYIYSCRKFVLFGSCGGLDKSIPPNKLIVPSHAYRDEGMSYHYAPAADYIEIKNCDRVADILGELGIDYVVGRSWTTDAFYRETRRNMERRRAEGCIAVEMELSACQAVADFRGCELYAFLYRADNLDSETWDKGILSLISLDERLAHFFIALKIAENVI
ncbi:MAG: nucleoside phosphorylase [Clostridia bacterium]|nr:nucleoside phosphorylase [Clostridia bacterium]